MNPEAWPESVIISEWYFKPRNVSDDEQNKRRRTTGNEDRVIETDGAGVTDPEPPPPAPFRVDDSPIASAEPAGAAAIALVDVGHDNDNDDTILDQHMDCHIDHGGEQ